MLLYISEIGEFWCKNGVSREHNRCRCKWYWIDKQTPEEVMVLRFFDSDLEAQGYTASGGVLHSSVEVLGTENEEVRESLEIRYFCIW